MHLPVDRVAQSHQSSEADSTQRPSPSVADKANLAELKKMVIKDQMGKNINDGNTRNAGQIGDLENYYLFEHRG